MTVESCSIPDVGRSEYFQPERCATVTARAKHGDCTLTVGRCHCVPPSLVSLPPARRPGARSDYVFEVRSYKGHTKAQYGNCAPVGHSVRLRDHDLAGSLLGLFAAAAASNSSTARSTAMSVSRPWCDGPRRQPCGATRSTSSDRRSDAERPRDAPYRSRSDWVIEHAPPDAVSRCYPKSDYAARASTVPGSRRLGIAQSDDSPSFHVCTRRTTVQCIPSTPPPAPTSATSRIRARLRRHTAPLPPRTRPRLRFLCIWSIPSISPDAIPEPHKRVAAKRPADRRQNALACDHALRTISGLLAVRALLAGIVPASVPSAFAAQPWALQGIELVVAGIC
jgi:hypothetical protein